MLQRFLCTYICCVAAVKYHLWGHPVIAAMCFLYGLAILVEGSWKNNES
jgi:hypothetical protein